MSVTGNYETLQEITDRTTKKRFKGFKSYSEYLRSKKEKALLHLWLSANVNH